MLTVYRDVYLANPKLRGEALLDATYAFYLERKNRRLAKVPIAPQRRWRKVRVIRNLLRYLEKAERVLVNIARAQLPREYYRLAIFVDALADTALTDILETRFWGAGQKDESCGFQCHPYASQKIEG